MDAHARAEAVAELERCMRPNRDVVAKNVVLADRRALSGLKTRADRRAGIDRREWADDGIRADHERKVALPLSTRRAAEDDVLTHHRARPELDVGRDHGRRVDDRAE